MSWGKGFVKMHNSISRNCASCTKASGVVFHFFPTRPRNPSRHNAQKSRSNFVHFSSKKVLTMGARCDIILSEGERYTLTQNT